MGKLLIITLSRDDDGRRADRIVRKVLKDTALSTIYRLFRQGDIRISNIPIAPNDRLKEGDVIEIKFSERSLEKGQNQTIIKSTLPKKEYSQVAFSEIPRILWQNAQLIAFDKPRGILVHDGSSSLNAYVQRILYDQLEPSASFSPGPLHRLDRNTSGIIFFSKTRKGAELFSVAMKNRRIRKFYAAIVQGKIDEPISLKDFILRDKKRKLSLLDDRKGKEASLYLSPLMHNKSYSFLLIELITGLTHQIRAQLASHGYPLVGDSKYGGSKTAKISSYFLHSCCLGFPEPIFEDMPLTIFDPLPGDFNLAVSDLFQIDHEEVDALISHRIEQSLEICDNNLFPEKGAKHGRYYQS
ncbi:MAG TPA: RluA family pseudouridine synthase [Rectinema sp.]|nr:RluA family pseudouridine synthase [Rectinema sp.]